MRLCGFSQFREKVKEGQKSYGVIALASSAAKNGFAAYSSADPVQVLLIVQTIIGSLISLIFPIYLFVRVLRASREPEEPEVMLVGENDMPPID